MIADLKREHGRWSCPCSLGHSDIVGLASRRDRYAVHRLDGVAKKVSLQSRGDERVWRLHTIVTLALRQGSDAVPVI